MTSYSTNEYHTVYRNITLSRGGGVFSVSQEGDFETPALDAESETKAFDQLADAETKYDSMINFKNSMTASFTMHGTICLPYLKKLFWENYIASNKNLLHKYATENNFKFANDEPMLFLLSRWLEQNSINLFIPPFSTEYKIYRYIVKYFLDIKEVSYYDYRVRTMRKHI